MNMPEPIILTTTEGEELEFANLDAVFNFVAQRMIERGELVDLGDGEDGEKTVALPGVLPQ